jgi:8-oxo-dGTP pyrophosphatase MutT (NUDIX family)
MGGFKKQASLSLPRTTTWTAAGSLMMKKSSSSSSELRRLALAFAAGMIASALVFRSFFDCPCRSARITNASASSSWWRQGGQDDEKKKRSQKNCQIYLGEYRGTEYVHEVQTVGTPECLVESKFLKVQKHHVQLLDNNDKNDAPPVVIDDWLWIDYHDRINVLVEAPASDDETTGVKTAGGGSNNNENKKQEVHFYAFRQTKYALENRQSWAIVGGIIEPGELPAAAAAREVEEELHVQCDDYIPLGRYRTDVNRGMGWTHTYLARRCRSSRSSPALLHDADADADGPVGGADTERQDVHRLSLAQVRAALRNGEFLEIQWSATVALALIHYEDESHEG